MLAGRGRRRDLGARRASNQIDSGSNGTIPKGAGIVRNEIKVGDKAPDFTLKDHNGRPVKLSDLAGKRVVLGFHPLAWTPVCAQQMKDLDANADKLAELGAVAFGISVDSEPCKKAWAESLGLTKTSLLADFWPHGGTAILYGIFMDDVGISQRCVFVLSPGAIVRFKKVYPIGQRPDINEIMAEVAKA